MSLLEAFFAGAVGKMIVDGMEEKKTTDSWNDRFLKLQQLEDDMRIFLESVGIPNTLVVLDPSLIEYNEIGLIEERTRLDTMKFKIREYISIGGNPKYIEDYELIDLYLEQIKRLGRLDMLDKQEEYLGLEMPSFDFGIMLNYWINYSDDDVENLNNVDKYLREQKSIIDSHLAITRGEEYKEWQRAQEYYIKMNNSFNEIVKKHFDIDRV